MSYIVIMNLRSWTSIIGMLVLVGCGASESTQAPSQNSVSAATTPVEGAVEEGAGEEPEPAGPEQEAAKVTISSVQLSQDCPSRELAAAPAKSARKAKAKGDRSSFHQPCTQSTVQLAIAGAPADSKFLIREARLILAGGDVVATLHTRSPSAWKDGVYQPWDEETLPDAQEDSQSKLSYKLSVPNWAELEEKLGKSSYGTLFVLELDVEVNGVTQTSRSAEFERSRPLMIKT